MSFSKGNFVDFIHKIPVFLLPSFFYIKYLNGNMGIDIPGKKAMTDNQVKKIEGIMRFYGLIQRINSSKGLNQKIHRILGNL